MGSAPEDVQQTEHLWVVQLQVVAGGGKEIVHAEERFGRFRKLLLGIGQGAGAFDENLSLRVASLLVRAIAAGG